MPELIHLERITKNAPKIFAVVNWPEYIVPARGYIGFMSDELIEKIYGGVEEAAQHFLIRTKKTNIGELNNQLSLRVYVADGTHPTIADLQLFAMFRDQIV